MSNVSQLTAIGCKRSYVRGERPSWEYSEDGTFVASDVWLVPRAVLTQAFNIIGGTIEDVGGVLSRLVPLRNADYEFAIAHKVRGDCDGWNSSTSAPHTVRCRIDYKAPIYPISGSDAYLSVDTSPGVRPVVFGGAAYGGGSFPDGIPQGIPTTHYNITMHRLASLPLATWASYANSTNNATWRGFSAGTVLFHGPTSHSTVSVAGLPAYEAQLHFEVCDTPWNSEYDTSGALTAYTINGSSWHTPRDFASTFGF